MSSSGVPSRRGGACSRPQSSPAGGPPAARPARRPSVRSAAAGEPVAGGRAEHQPERRQREHQRDAREPAGSPPSSARPCDPAATTEAATMSTKPTVMAASSARAHRRPVQASTPSSRYTRATRQDHRPRWCAPAAPVDPQLLEVGEVLGRQRRRRLPGAGDRQQPDQQVRQCRDEHEQQRQVHRPRPLRRQHGLRAQPGGRRVGGGVGEVAVRVVDVRRLGRRLPPGPRTAPPVGCPYCDGPGGLAVLLPGRLLRRTGTGGSGSGGRRVRAGARRRSSPVAARRDLRAHAATVGAPLPAVHDPAQERLRIARMSSDIRTTA